jgi:hypothetical protein
MFFKSVIGKSNKKIMPKMLVIDEIDITKTFNLSKNLFIEK